MSSIAPFRAWRPAIDKVHLVASRSYLTYTPAQLAAKLNHNPYTFLHIINPDGKPGKKRISTDRFLHVKERFEEFCEAGILEREDRPALYIYEQIKEGHSSVGIICSVAVKDYVDGCIKKHEHTLEKRERMFAKYLEVTGINAEPVLLSTSDTYDGHPLPKSLRCYTQERPQYDFTATSRVRHRLWVVTDEEAIREAQQSLQDRDLYIADGHHRSASSAAISALSESDPKARFMALVMVPQSLRIINYDRLVTDLNGLTEEQFLIKLRDTCTVRDVDDDIRPSHGEFLLVMKDGNHIVTMPSAPEGTPTEATLDAARLSEVVLGPLLNITDLRNDKRILFAPGHLGLKYARQQIYTRKAQAAFILYPVTFHEMKAVADEGGCMPPKSTWIEPKLRSGLTIYSLNDE